MQVIIKEKDNKTAFMMCRTYSSSSTELPLLSLNYFFRLVIKYQTFECSAVCKFLKFGISLEFISVAAAMCIT